MPRNTQILRGIFLEVHVKLKRRGKNIPLLFAKLLI